MTEHDLALLKASKRIELICLDGETIVGDVVMCPPKTCCVTLCASPTAPSVQRRFCQEPSLKSRLFGPLASPSRTELTASVPRCLCAS